MSFITARLDRSGQQARQDLVAPNPEGASTLPPQPAFPPILIISLARASARRAKLRARLEDLGLAFEFMDAVDGLTLTAADRAVYNGRKRRIFMGKDLYPGEIACLLSHKHAIARVAADDTPWLILEDDVQLGDDFPAVIRALMATPDDWELVRFFGDEKHAKRLQRKLLPLAAGYWLTRLSTTPGEAHAYLISPAGARKLLRQLRYTGTPIDTLMGQPWKTGLEALTVWPGLAWQDKQLGSDIGDARFERGAKTKGLERALYPVASFALRLTQNLLKRGFYYGHALSDHLRLRRRLSCQTGQRRSTEGGN